MASRDLLPAGTRDKLMHDHFGVDDSIVRDIIGSGVPGLAEKVGKVLTTAP